MFAGFPTWLHGSASTPVVTWRAAVFSTTSMATAASTYSRAPQTRSGSRLLFINRGDGTFLDQSQKAGLTSQIAVPNRNDVADYDNDGDLDIYLMGGGWEIRSARRFLARNLGDGTFPRREHWPAASARPLHRSQPRGATTTTTATSTCSSLANIYPTGLTAASRAHKLPEPDPRNLCRLYRNNGDGTFSDVAAAAGVRQRAPGQGGGVGRLRWRRPARSACLELWRRESAVP